MFGLVTKRELDQLRADLAADVHKSRALQDDIAYEWAKWFNKFRSLYALLLKREKSAQVPGDEEEERGDAHPPATPGRQLSFRSRRPF